MQHVVHHHDKSQYLDPVNQVQLVTTIISCHRIDVIDHHDNKYDKHYYRNHVDVLQCRSYVWCHVRWMYNERRVDVFVWMER